MVSGTSDASGWEGVGASDAGPSPGSGSALSGPAEASSTSSGRRHDVGHRSGRGRDGDRPLDRWAHRLGGHGDHRRGLVGVLRGRLAGRGVPRRHDGRRGPRTAPGRPIGHGSHGDALVTDEAKHRRLDGLPERSAAGGQGAQDVLSGPQLLPGTCEHGFRAGSRRTAAVAARRVSRWWVSAASRSSSATTAPGGGPPRCAGAEASHLRRTVSVRSSSSSIAARTGVASWVHAELRASNEVASSSGPGEESGGEDVTTWLRTAPPARAQTARVPTTM